MPAKIKLGPAGAGGYANSTIEGVQKLYGLGLQTMEVEFVHGVGMGIDLAKKIGIASRKNDVPLSVHAPFFINLASKEPAKIQASKKRIIDSAERMHYMGGGPVVFHPAFFGGTDKEIVFNQTKDAILDMLILIKEKKWKAILAPETTGKHSALGSLEEIIRISQETGCSLCVDFSHLFARNNGKIDYRKILDKIEGELGAKHVHSHFSGIEYTDKGEKNHVVMGANNPSFTRLAKELIDRSQDITIICESPITYKDSQKMRRILEGFGYKF